MSTDPRSERKVRIPVSVAGVVPNLACRFTSVFNGRLCKPQAYGFMEK